MGYDRRRLRLMAAMVTTGAFACSGCLRDLNPIRPGPCEGRHLAESLPRYSRDAVHIFLVNGLDPLEAGNLAGVREYINGLGFPNTFYAQAFHGPVLRAEIDAIRRRCPHARFVVIGFDAGAVPARNLARRAAMDGAPVDLLLYLAPVGLDRQLEAVEPGLPVFRVACYRGDPVLWDHADARDAVSHRVGGAGHYDLPTDPVTLDLLTRELTAVAARVPVPEPPPAPRPLPAAPPPRSPVPFDPVPPEWGVTAGG